MVRFFASSSLLSCSHSRSGAVIGVFQFLCKYSFPISVDMNDPVVLPLKLKFHQDGRPPVFIMALVAPTDMAQLRSLVLLLNRDGNGSLMILGRRMILKKILMMVMVGVNLNLMVDLLVRLRNWTRRL